MTTGEKIRAMRKSHGMTLAQLAERIGVTASAISQYERGKLAPTYVVLVKAAAALACSVADITSEDDYLSFQEMASVIKDVHSPNGTLNLEEARKTIQESDSMDEYWKNEGLFDVTFVEYGLSTLVDDTTFTGYSGKMGPYMVPGHVAIDLLESYSALNITGQMRVMEYIHDLLAVPKYCKRKEP